MSGVAWLGAVVNAKQWPTQVTCFDACWHRCNEDLNVSPVPGYPAGPPLLVELCAAKCFDDSGCVLRPTSSTPILEWEPTDETLPPPKPKPVPTAKPPQAPSAPPASTPAPAPAPRVARRRSTSVVPALVGIALVGLLAYGVLS